MTRTSCTDCTFIGQQHELIAKQQTTSPGPIFSNVIKEQERYFQIVDHYGMLVDSHARTVKITDKKNKQIKLD